ncbi:hypothetical protein [Pararhodobacter oceanensis]|uniref:hypothetical protein n=1 Tax=Pararhodobacter oceanensis TaxID=2172121 RepID=UPI003A8D40A8
MRILITLLIFLSLSACGRPLTLHETELASRLFGDGLDSTQVRFSASRVIGLREHQFRARPQTTCRERIVPPPTTEILTGRTAGVTLWNHIRVRDDLMQEDFVRLPDGTMPLGLAMFFAHEVTHVWQWQNRATTGYSPLRVGLEHQRGVDPYLFDADHAPNFSDYGYEQQASLVEEYVCCAALDPQGRRTRRLHALLSQVMEPRDLPDWPVRIPWRDAQTRGICS